MYLYTFVNSGRKIGLTNCAPLWGNQDPAKYYGTYCHDIFPVSDSSTFLAKYFTKYTETYSESKSKAQDKIFNYIVMNKTFSTATALDPDAGDGSQLDVDEIKTLLDDYVFSNVKDQNGHLSNYTVADIKLRNVTLADLKEYVQAELAKPGGKYGITRFELIAVE